MNTNTTICVCACVARSGAAFGAPIYITGFSDAVLNFVEQWQGIPSAAIRDNPVYDTGLRLLVDATQAQDYPAYIAEVVGLYRTRPCTASSLSRPEESAGARWRWLGSPQTESPSA